MRVAIVALGPSGTQWLRLAEGLGDWQKQFDELWLVNGFVNVFWPVYGKARGFAMDDVRIQELRAKAGNKKIANLLDAYKKHPGPIYTSRAHPDYPSLVEFPLEEVINSGGRDYFNSTVAYPIALAIHERASMIGLFGADYSFPDKHTAEKGRGCCEYWLGVAAARGIKIGIASGSSLMDVNEPSTLYGYDTVNVVCERDANGWTSVRFEELPESEWPTGFDIEARYDKTGAATK